MLILLSMNDKMSSISFQTVEQIEVIPEIVLLQVSKLIDSVKSKRQEGQRPNSFLEKKGLHKIQNGLHC